MFAALNSFLTRAVSGYFLNKSLRFRFSAGAYLNRTFGTPTNNIKWTWSAWVKRGKLSSAGVMFQGYSSLSNRTALQFNSSDQLVFNGTVATATTTAVFRDPAAWYHIVCVYDSANGTAANRLLLYVNGTVQTVTGTQPTASQVEYINGAWLHYISTGYSGVFEYLDEDLAEVNFVDGQALLPASFGASSIYNQWLPIRYAGTYGTNGFYLPFTNTASTSTLVADSSGNANNWTPNNISLTAGSTYDSLTDVPTLTSETVANYAVLNPLVPPELSTTFNDGNLRFVGAGAVVGSMGMSAKTYVEMTPASATDVAIGVGPLVSGSRGGSGSGIQDSVFWFSSGSVFKDGGATAVATYATFTTNDVCAFTFDPSNRQVTFYKNNVSQGSQTVSGTQAISFYTLGNAGATAAVNFGQQPFTYTAPSGFLPLNTFNIAAGTVTTSGTFTGNLSTDGPFVFLNGTPTAMTINGNAVTFGTQADKLANGFKVRSSSASYNASGSNTYVATTVAEVLKYENAQPNP
jgi:hypothetical protein